MCNCLLQVRWGEVAMVVGVACVRWVVGVWVNDGACVLSYVGVSMFHQYVCATTGGNDAWYIGVYMLYWCYVVLMY